MKVNTVGRPVQQKNKKYIKAARRGALITAGTILASTAVSWKGDTDYMKDVVYGAGGKLKYLKTVTTGLAILSAGGALFGAALSFISDKVKSKKPPKAV